MSANDDAFALGWKQHQAGNTHQAEQTYQQILRADPSDARVWFVLGNLYQDRKQWAEAENCFRQAVRLKPLEPDGHYSLANVLLQQVKYDEAAAELQRCLELKPDYAAALINLGFIRGEQGKPDEALPLYLRALPLSPELPELHHNLGNTYRDQGKFELAVQSYQEALRLRPDYFKVLLNVSMCLTLSARPALAEGYLRQAMELKPDDPEVLNSLGAAICSQGRLQEGMEYYERALQVKPDAAEVHWNIGLLHLYRGNYSRGWEEYEWRWKCPKTSPRFSFAQPRWDGSALTGKTILFQEEQGLGDMIQFIRFAQVAKERGGRVLFHCPPPLLRLFASCPWIDQLIPCGQPLPPFDVQAPLLSLPHILGMTVATVPRTVPYLFPDPELVEFWRKELAPIRGFRVGFVWQGSPSYGGDRLRSIPLACFESLSRVPGVRLISLQKGHGVEQLRELGGRFPILSLGGQLDEAAGPFMDTAAIMHNLDLVVSIDTSITHLAGAMGLPVWLVLSAAPHWCWIVNREDSPWYPTLRIFRQRTLGQWQEVFERVAAALREAAAAKPRPSTVQIEVAPGELIDKITILEIKSEQFKDAEKLRNVRNELATLQTARDLTLTTSEELVRLTEQLKAINQAIWDTEDAIRLCERAQDFGPRFIELARAVYHQNDRRAAIKRQINLLLGSRLLEEKAYVPYTSM